MANPWVNCIVLFAKFVNLVCKQLCRKLNKPMKYNERGMVYTKTETIEFIKLQGCIKINCHETIRGVTFV